MIDELNYKRIIDNAFNNAVAEAERELAALHGNAGGSMYNEQNRV